MDDQQIKELADAIYVEKIRRARAMAPEEKMGAGIRLFEERLAEMRKDFRVKFPTVSDSEVEDLVKRQLDEERRLNEVGLYSPIPPLKSAK